MASLRALGTVLLLSVATSGCTPEMSGRYEDAAGLTAYEFNPDGSVVISVLGTRIRGHYEVRSDRVLVHSPQGSVVLLRTERRLSGPTGLELVRARAPTTAARATSALPLRRGFYVASDTACEAASNATLLRLRRNGIGGARDFCAFTEVQQTGPRSWQVTETCDSAPGESVSYQIPDDTRFTSKSQSGWERSARHCEQSRLPADWRDTDISDFTD